MINPDAFIPVPVYPGYSVNGKGQVQSPSGSVLAVDRQGRVQVRVDGKTRRCFVGEMMTLAGVSREMAMEVTTLYFQLGLARRLNGHLLALTGADPAQYAVQ